MTTESCAFYHEIIISHNYRIEGDKLNTLINIVYINVLNTAMFNICSISAHLSRSSSFVHI